MKRLVLAGTVVIWAAIGAARSAVGALGADYWDPVTLLDYTSIWAYSATLAMSAVIAWQAAWLARSHRSSAFAGVAAGVGFAVAAAANAAEDALGMSSFGIVYVVGVLLGILGALVLAAALAVARARLLAGLAALLLVPFVFLESWLGLLLLLPAGWIALHIARGPVVPRPATQAASPAPSVTA